jgi:hypothetical protein
MKLSELLAELEKAQEMARERSGDKELDPEVFVAYPSRGSFNTTISMDHFHIAIKNKRQVVIGYII